MPFTVLYVCTGNICRSPMAELMTAARVSAAAVAVGSAGTRGWAGSPMEPGASRALAARGLAPDGFRARRLTPSLVASADLVLGLAREHRAEVVTLVPAAVRRTFTVREFARLTAGLAAPVSGPALVAAALRRRGTLPPVPAADDDVADPLGLPDDAFAACADLLDTALSGWVGLLGV